MTTESPPILVERKEMVKVITLNRPPLNIVNPAMLRRLLEELQSTAQDRSIRAVILTGSGQRAFCAGADMGDEEAFDQANASNLFREMGRKCVGLIESLPQPVIAAVDGYCAGGGTGLAWPCDFVIATDRARFGARDAYLGMVPSWSVGMVRLARWIGRRNALEILLLGEWFPAEKGKEYGLVSKVVPPEKLMDEAMEIANRICSAAPLAIERLKQGVRKTLFEGYEAACRYEAEASDFIKTTWDAREGIQAFMEKRKPNFKGK
jgi:enoyl-CoA hydratase/carnithine racemase